MIASGEFGQGSRLPSEASLADRYGVTRMTIRHALDGLLSDGLITRRKGSGTFVTQRTLGRPLNRLTSFSEDMRTQGELSARVLVQEEADPPEEVAEKLALEPGVRVVLLERLRLVDGTPTAVHRSWLHFGASVALAREPVGDRSLYSLLEEKYGIRLLRAEQRITAIRADVRLAGLLDVRRGSPLLKVERVAYATGNEPVEYVESWTKPELPLWVELRR